MPSTDSRIENGAIALDEARRRRPVDATPSGRTDAAESTLAPAKKKRKVKAPYHLAELYVGQHFTSGRTRTLQFWRGEFFEHRDGYWRKVSRDDKRAAVYRYLVERKIAATRRAVDDLLDALRAVVKLSDDIEAPWWIEGAGPDAAHLVACRNGLLDVRTRELLPVNPGFFNVNALAFDYLRDAATPKGWLAFGEALFPDAPDDWYALQEMFGYLLTTDTAQQKAFMLIGPPRSGKGTIARILRRLIGPANVCAPMLANLGAQFGLQELIGKLLALISDARLSGRADVDAIVENLLRLSGEDPVTVPRKFMPDYTGHLAARFLVLTNEVPALADASGALASRFIIMRLRTSFLGREDVGLYERMLPELPGILLWALDGLDRLRARGHFVQPASGAEVARDMRELGSPLKHFVNEACCLDREGNIECDALFEAWRDWSRQQGRESGWTVQMFGSRLRTCFPELDVDRGKRVPGQRRLRKYVGIRLRLDTDPDPEGGD